MVKLYTIKHFCCCIIASYHYLEREGVVRCNYAGKQLWIFRVFIKYCVFSEDFEIFQTLAFLCFPSVSVYRYTHQEGRTPALQQN